MKHCNKCNVDKTINQFSKHSTTEDGYTTICKECYKNFYAPVRKESLALDKAKKKYAAKKKLEASPPPDLDLSLHTASVKAADELAKLNSSNDLSGHDITKMKSLIDILLTIRKHARPVTKKEKEKPISTDELFE